MNGVEARRRDWLNHKLLRWGCTMATSVLLACVAGLAIEGLFVAEEFNGVVKNKYSNYQIRLFSEFGENRLRLVDKNGVTREVLVARGIYDEVAIGDDLAVTMGRVSEIGE